MPEPAALPDDFGGWSQAEANTLREGARLSLYEKLLWLEEIEEVFLQLQRSPNSTPTVSPPRSPDVSL